MRQMVNGTGLVMAQDFATAGCGLLSGLYFAGYWWQRNGSPGRRLGALALVFVSLAAVVEALFSQGLFWSERGVLAGPSAEVWALARLPLLIATVFISILVVRRLRS
jgi:hypothetical protein